MPVSRMRMRPWLEDMIESHSIPGLRWIDREKKIFCIPWKHAARHGWEMDKDACLFKQWAIHTGKYREGEGSPDPKTWKANFRCAMNSLPDIEEEKNQSVNKGHGAVRVYRMLPAVAKKRDKRSSTKDGKHKGKVCKRKVEISNEDNEDSRTSGEDNSMQENTVDSTQNHSDSDFALSPSGNEEAVPMDWGFSPDSTNLAFPYHKFQVSPLHSSDADEDEAAIIALAQQIEEDDVQWRQCSEVGTTETFSSPGSQYSDTSSEEIDIRLYTELTARVTDPMDLVEFLDPFNSRNVYPFTSSIDPFNPLPISCPF